MNIPSFKTIIKKYDKHKVFIISITQNYIKLHLFLIETFLL